MSCCSWAGVMPSGLPISTTLMPSRVDAVARMPSIYLANSHAGFWWAAGNLLPHLAYTQVGWATHQQGRQQQKAAAATAEQKQQRPAAAAAAEQQQQNSSSSSSTAAAAQQQHKQQESSGGGKKAAATARGRKQQRDGQPQQLGLPARSHTCRRRLTKSWAGRWPVQDRAGSLSPPAAGQPQVPSGAPRAGRPGRAVGSCHPRRLSAGRARLGALSPAACRSAGSV